jgi:hypothetical protein
MILVLLAGKDMGSLHFRFWNLDLMACSYFRFWI